MVQMAGNGWKEFKISPETQLTDASAIKSFFEPYIGNHKRAFAMLDTDWSSIPSISRQFVSAVWHNGFAVSQWTRVNNSTAWQTNAGFSGTNYWTTVYDLILAPTDTVLLLIDMNS